VVHGLDVVPVGVEDEGAVVAGDADRHVIEQGSLSRRPKSTAAYALGAEPPDARGATSARDSSCAWHRTWPPGSWPLGGRLAGRALAVTQGRALEQIGDASPVGERQLRVELVERLEGEVPLG
jgi:hypothetical protein